MRYLVRPYSRSFKRHPRQQGRSILVLLLLLLLWSICLGWGLSVAAQPRSIVVAQGTTPASPEPTPQSTTSVGTVDVVPDRLKRGQAVYLENCATCHLGLPPAVMPTQTWQQLLQDPEHYGATITPLSGSPLRITWDYIRFASRPIATEEEVPYRLYQSNYFKILHPKVKLPTRAGLSTCISCHPGADKYDFRSLTSEWQNAP